MEWFWLAFLVPIGACVGSFLNVLIYRLPRRESIVFPGSRCPACGRSIRWYDNIPLVSWFVLRGRCRACQAPISPRYIVVEAMTAVLVVGLYACYFLLEIRDGAGRFSEAWPMFVAHAALLCGLLVCLWVDLEHWVIPLEVMWVCSLVGVAAAAFRPHPFLPTVSPEAVAMSVAALIGLGVAMALTRWGFIQPSFLDAKDSPAEPAAGESKPARKAGGEQAPIRSVAFTAAHGVNPRVEVLREVLFLSPAIVLAAGAAAVLRWVPAIGDAWRSGLDARVHPVLARHLLAAGSALFGYLIGGAWIWGVRILGTLAFGKEAMGLGDAHLLAAVGAVTGWIVPSVAFFVAPFLGLMWALYLWAARSQRELPYGPWLAGAALLTMLFYDAIAEFLGGYAATLQALLNGGTRP